MNCFCSYAASGAAYGAVNTDRDLDWCTMPDKGLPAPDLVVLLEANGEAVRQRSGWGDERFENKQFQTRVAKNYRILAAAANDTWKIIENKDIDATHAEIVKAAIDTITRVAESPINTLYPTQ